MIKLIVGEKGTGKTKAVIKMANDAVKEKKGDVIFIDGSSRYTMTLDRDIRFINLNDFRIDSLKMFYGFLSGIVAQNYDIDCIYIDGIFETINGQLQDIEAFFFDLKGLADKFSINFIITLTGNPQDVPTFLKDYIA